MKWKRNAIVFLASQSISLLGSSLVQFAITWHITQATQSGTAMTISVLCGYLPQLLVSLFAGVWADRYDRKKIIMLADGVTAASTAVAAALFASGYRKIWLLYLVSAIRSFGGAMQAPTVSAVIPSITPKEQLMRINAINGSIQSLISLAAPALGGVILTALQSIEAVFMIDVATAAIAIFCVAAFLRLKRQPVETGASPAYAREIREGFRYIRTHRLLLHMFVYTTLISILIAPVAMLVPLQIVRSFGEDVRYVSGAQFGLALGMLAGGLLMSAWGGCKNRIHTMLIAAWGVGAMMIAAGFPLPFPHYLACIFAAGFCVPLMLTPANVILQERVDGQYLGRVFSVMSMISGSMTPLGMLIFGPLADHIPISWLLTGTGAATILTGLILLLDPVAKEAGIRKSS